MKNYTLHPTPYTLSKVLVTGYCLLSTFLALPAKADTVSLRNPIGASTIPEIAGMVIKAFLGITGSIALLMFIYGGFLWLTAAGNADRIKQGKGTLTWAAIGIAFIFSSYLIASFIINGLQGQST